MTGKDDWKRLTKDDDDRAMAGHVARAAKMALVVPTAIAMATAGVSVHEARKMLDKEPILRKAIEKIRGSSLSQRP